MRICIPDRSHCMNVPHQSLQITTGKPMPEKKKPVLVPVISIIRRILSDGELCHISSRIDEEELAFKPILSLDLIRKFLAQVNVLTTVVLIIKLQYFFFFCNHLFVNKIMKCLLQ